MMQFRPLRAFRAKHFAAAHKQSNMLRLTATAFSSTPRSSSNWKHYYEDYKGSMFYIGAGSITFYGLSRIFYDVTYNFLSLTPGSSLYYGFMGGSVTTVICGSSLLIGYGTLFLHPDVVFRKASRLVVNDSNITRILGDGKLTYDEIKGYKSIAGGFQFLEGRSTWKNPECFLIYHVSNKSKNISATVSVKAYKKNFKENFEFIGVEVIKDASQSKERVIVVGDKEVYEQFDTIHKKDWL